MAYVEVEIDLYDIETADLIDELQRRKRLPDDYDYSNKTQLLDLYEAKRYNTGKFDELFSQYIWEQLGKHV